jgi:hypothetical protein
MEVAGPPCGVLVDGRAENGPAPHGGLAVLRHERNGAIMNSFFPGARGIVIGSSDSEGGSHDGIFSATGRGVVANSPWRKCNVTSSQSTMLRIFSGDQVPKMPELVAIAWATGHTVAELTGSGTIAGRAQSAARPANDSGTDPMREALVQFLELDDYLTGQAIPATV